MCVFYFYFYVYVYQKEGNERENIYNIHSLYVYIHQISIIIIPFLLPPRLLRLPPRQARVVRQRRLSLSLLFRWLCVRVCVCVCEGSRCVCVFIIKWKEEDDNNGAFIAVISHPHTHPLSLPYLSQRRLQRVGPLHLGERRVLVLLLPCLRPLVLACYFVYLFIFVWMVWVLGGGGREG